MTAQAKAHWQLHFCVLLWGFTAILGKLITLTALQLVWWRMLIVTLALLLLPKVWRALRWRLWTSQPLIRPGFPSARGGAGQGS